MFVAMLSSAAATVSAAAGVLFGLVNLHGRVNGRVAGLAGIMLNGVALAMTGIGGMGSVFYMLEHR
jgi:hypothetical protein